MKKNSMKELLTCIDHYAMLSRKQLIDAIPEFSASTIYQTIRNAIKLGYIGKNKIGLENNRKITYFYLTSLGKSKLGELSMDDNQENRALLAGDCNRKSKCSVKILVVFTVRS